MLDVVIGKSLYTLSYSTNIYDGDFADATIGYKQNLIKYLK